MLWWIIQTHPDSSLVLVKTDPYGIQSEGFSSPWCCSVLRVCMPSVEPFIFQHENNARNHHSTSFTDGEAEVRELWPSSLLPDRVSLLVSKFKIKPKLKGGGERKQREEKCSWLTGVIKISPGSYGTQPAQKPALDPLQTQPRCVWSATQPCTGLDQINVELHELALAHLGFGPGSTWKCLWSLRTWGRLLVRG